MLNQLLMSGVETGAVFVGVWGVGLRDLGVSCVEAVQNAALGGNPSRLLGCDLGLGVFRK